MTNEDFKGYFLCSPLNSIGPVNGYRGSSYVKLLRNPLNLAGQDRKQLIISRKYPARGKAAIILKINRSQFENDVAQQTS